MVTTPHVQMSGDFPKVTQIISCGAGSGPGSLAPELVLEGLFWF